MNENPEGHLIILSSSKVDADTLEFDRLSLRVIFVEGDLEIYRDPVANVAGGYVLYADVVGGDSQGVEAMLSLFCVGREDFSRPVVDRDICHVRTVRAEFHLEFRGFDATGWRARDGEVDSSLSSHRSSWSPG